jgi:hypothetical protein
VVWSESVKVDVELEVTPASVAVSWSLPVVVVLSDSDELSESVPVSCQVSAPVAENVSVPV